MSENKPDPAVRYFTVPQDVKSPIKGLEGMLTFRDFFVEFCVPRLPRNSMDRLGIVRTLSVLAEAVGGQKFELTEACWAALERSLPLVGVDGGVAPRVYLAALSFWESVEGAPSTKPEGWDEAA